MAKHVVATMANTRWSVDLGGSAKVHNALLFPDESIYIR